MDDPIRVGPCPVCGDYFCVCSKPSSSTGAIDHPRAFTEAILDYTPTIAKSGNRLSIEFDIPEQAEDAHDLLCRAIDSVKPASTA